jgi:hypothetical protein
MASRKLWLAVASAMVCFSAFAANIHPGLLEVKKVYLLPMTSGLDQYLANRLTRTGRFEVVTDPANADAVFTDRLGPAFEDKWNEMYPPPPKPEDVKPVDAKTDAKADAKAEGDKPKAEPKIEDIAAPPVTRISSFSRGRGNVFLVSRKNGAVVWSDYKMPKRTGSKELNSTADGIVERLNSDLNIKK